MSDATARDSLPISRKVTRVSVRREVFDRDGAPLGYVTTDVDSTYVELCVPVEIVEQVRRLAEAALTRRQESPPAKEKREDAAFVRGYVAAVAEMARRRALIDPDGLLRRANITRAVAVESGVEPFDLDTLTDPEGGVWKTEP